jgi:hypothetical protein
MRRSFVVRSPVIDQPGSRIRLIPSPMPQPVRHSSVERGDDVEWRRETRSGELIAIWKSAVSIPEALLGATRSNRC